MTWRRSRVTWILGALASILVVGALLRVTAGPGFVHALGRIGFAAPIVIALGWLALLAVQTLRYRATLGAVAPQSFADLYLLRALANALNAYLPARAGDVARIELLSRRSGATRRAIVGGEVVDNLVDLLGWLPALLGVTLVGHAPAGLVRFVPWIVAAGGASLALLFVLGRVRRVPAFLEPVRHGLTVHGPAKVALRALLLGPLRWWVEALVILVAARLAGLALDPSAAFAALTALSFAYVVPIPANAGTIELSLAAALTALGFEAGTAMAFAVAYHVGQLVPMTILGGIALWRVRPGDAQSAAASDPRLAVPQDGFDR